MFKVINFIFLLLSFLTEDQRSLYITDFITRGLKWGKELCLPRTLHTFLSFHPLLLTVFAFPPSLPLSFLTSALSSILQYSSHRFILSSFFPLLFLTSSKIDICSSPHLSHSIVLFPHTFLIFSSPFSPPFSCLLSSSFSHTSSPISLLSFY